MFRLTLSTTALPLLATLSLAGCPSGGGTGEINQPTGGDDVTTTKAPTAKLVLSIVLDQMPSSAILRFAPHLPEDGVIRRAIEGGLFQERVRYGYAGTNTAPGHASIYTGELPADHGIDRNDIYSSETGRIKIVNDGKHPVFGVEGGFASPFRLKKPTIGDLLHKASPESKVVSVSLKARAAVVSAGTTPDLVTWYDPRLPGFTTSSFYEDAMPDWMAAWNAANPLEDRLGVWKPENPELYQQVVGADDAPGESDWHGLGKTFPHDFKNTRKPAKTFVATPASMHYLLDMTRTVIEQFQLGSDAHPDLLMLSVSTTDYAGHSYGSASWEYLDVLIKTDRALGELVRELEQTTEVAVLITSDHGGTPLAELSQKEGKPGGRVVAEVLIKELDALAVKALGPGPWVTHYIQPFLYLGDQAYDSEKYPELLEIIDNYVAGNSTIEAIFTPNEARQWRDSEEWLKRDVARTISDSARALFLVPAEGHVAASTLETRGTGHGTPWDPDREVSVLAFGAGITKSHDATTTAQDRVAPTIAALLNLSWHLPAKALEGAPQPKAP